MDKSDIIKKIQSEEDYIRYPKFGNSLSRLLSKNSEGVEDSVIARILMIQEKDVQKIYEEAVRMLRAGMVDED